MTLYEFNQLNDPEKAEAVWDGTLIGDRTDNIFNILLYQIDSFYVEVYYQKRRNIIKWIRSFSSTDQLLPYLEKMDLDIKFDK
ncbi:MAG: hypothetical protein M3015_11660 [Bacteroidota bacterium]|nr:hypothetical protein [Bacteroidota bacterium]